MIQWRPSLFSVMNVTGQYGGIMKKYEYDITKYSASEFTHLVYFCTEQGQCKFDQIPEDQTRVLNEVLNEKGSRGWELVDIAFGKDGLVAFWKQEIILLDNK